MIELKLIKPEKLPKNSEFLWRYFDIHKLLNFIKQKSIRFTRMDQFEDALEGIPFETLERFAKINNEQKLNLASIILEPNRSLLFTNSKIFGRIDQIIHIQSSHFVSCWFFEERESMAMWNLYSNSDGVALKIPFGKLKDNLKPKIVESNIEDYFCGKVVYQDFRNQNPYSKNGLSKLGKVSLRKDISFSHEKEVRFIVKTNPKNSESILGIESEKFNLKELDLKVVCHPRMKDWKKENIRQLLKDNKLLNAFSESEIKLRY
jgi:hypothetical protein